MKMPLVRGGLALSFATVCLLLLSGCLTPEQQAAQRAMYLDDIRQRCLSYGYPPGTADLASCVQQTVQADEFRQQMEMDRMQVENRAAMERLQWRAEMAQREAWARQEAARREAARREAQRRDREGDKDRDHDRGPPKDPH